METCISNMHQCVNYVSRICFQLESHQRSVVVVVTLKAAVGALVAGHGSDDKYEHVVRGPVVRLAGTVWPPLYSYTHEDKALQESPAVADKPARRLKSRSQVIQEHRK